MLNAPRRCKITSNVAIEYRNAPTEVNGPGNGKGRVCSPPFTGNLHPWNSELGPRAIALSCGDSSATGLSDRSADLVVTDPPFFDNVHYSELADFFYAWRHLDNGVQPQSTRSGAEVQDSDAQNFAGKLQAVLRECHRVLKDDGLLVFTYHHSREEGWSSLASALLGAGFSVVNSHPVRAEMSVATPKAQAKEPIQLDIILVCRKAEATRGAPRISESEALESARAKLRRLRSSGLKLSHNDRRIVLFGQLLTSLSSPDEARQIGEQVHRESSTIEEMDADSAGTGGSSSRPTRHRALKSPQGTQGVLFE
jgi:putative DNA methylase